MRRGSSTQLVTVLFTDIVGSTEIAREVGDRRWRELVDAHHRIVRGALRRHGGRELDTAGDGFFASFDRPAEAIRCAFEVSEGVRDVGLEIRAGLHLGEAEVMGPKVGGVAVNTAARIMGAGKAGEVLVSSTVRDAVAGKGIEFADHGEHELKGLDGEFHLFDAVSVDGQARGLPLEPQEARRRREQPLPEPVRRRPWWLAAAAAVVVVVAAIGIATSLGGSGRERTQTGPTGATEGRVLTGADRSVIDLVPTGFADTCVATAPLPRDAVGSVTCTDGEYEVRYDTYVDPGTLDAAFAASTAGLDLPGTSCRDDPAASGVYHIDGTQRGKVACAVDRLTLSFVSRLVWTDDDLLVLAAASREDVTDFRGSVPDLSLYEWWRTSAGPGPGGSFRPKDDPADVPSGTFRSVITEAQAGPIDEGGASERWVGTWTITLEGSSLTETFDDALAEQPIAGGETSGDSSYELISELAWGKGNRMIVIRSDTFGQPLGGPTAPCRSHESVAWELDGDRLVFSRPSQEPGCRDFRGVAVFQRWERVG